MNTILGLNIRLKNLTIVKITVKFLFLLKTFIFTFEVVSQEPLSITVHLELKRLSWVNMWDW